MNSAPDLYGALMKSFVRQCRQHSFPEERGDIAPGKQMAIVLLASLIIGTYDGFYGPGTGTFLILIFCNLAKLDLRTASGNVKVVNLSSNIGGVTTALLNGKVFVALGLIGAVASIAGHYIGSGLAIKDGSRIVRPVIVVVLSMLEGTRKKKPISFSTIPTAAASVTPR